MKTLLMVLSLVTTVTLNSDPNIRVSMTKLIEVVHSTYGIVKLTLSKSDYGTIRFHRNDGSWTGEMDKDGGGLLQHPNLSVASFIQKVQGESLLEADERGYIELEDKLYKAADAAFPGFFKKEKA